MLLEDLGSESSTFQFPLFEFLVLALELAMERRGRKTWKYLFIRLSGMIVSRVSVPSDWCSVGNGTSKAQKRRDKKTLIFFFAFHALSGKLGNLRFRAAKTFFFDHTFFLYQDENPVHHMIHWKQFSAFLNPASSDAFKTFQRRGNYMLAMKFEGGWSTALTWRD
jgi:hypothetical protein